MKQNLKQSQPLIIFRDATLQLRDRRILSHIDWSIRSDEHWAIVGANGSGKSVLARALYGAIPVVGGEVEYHFLDGGGQKPGSRYHTAEDAIAHISFEDQRYLIGMESSYHQSRWNSADNGSTLTAFDVLSRAAETRQNGKARQLMQLKQSRAVQQLDIGHLLDRKVTHLSNGEVRKVLIAQALLQAPLVMILDEPFVGLDYRSRRALRRIINELMQADMRIFFVTSRIEEIPSGITHMLWVDDGKIVGAGEKKTIFNMMGAEEPTHRNEPAPFVQPATPKPHVLVPPKPAILVKMRDVSVIYDGVEVLKGIDWTIEEGQDWAVLGPNGSGKTTLLSLILADNPQAYSNDICLFGRKRGSGENIWDIKKKTGWVSSEIQIHYQRAMTCYDVVCSGFFDSIGLYRECSAWQKQIASARMRNLGLWNLAGRRFDELSSGQQRMVLLARASVKNPRLLILDEPCQGLDLDNRRLLLEAIDTISRRGKSSLIYVAHRLNEIPDCISHVLRLRKGRVVKKGSRMSVLGK